MDDNIGYVLKKLEDMGELDNTLVVFTTDNGAETITFPDGGVTPFRGGKLTTWEGGMRAPMVVRWPGHIKPGVVKDQIFSALDWVPTLVNIAGGQKGDGLKKQIEAGKYPGIVKTTLDGFDQRAYLEGKGDSARDHLFYYSGSHPSAVRYKNWKLYYAMAPSTASGGLMGVQTYHWTQITNIKRDPFERNVLSDQSLMAAGGALAAPSTAFIYDWNLLPIGQMMWMKELETYKKFPSLQAPASYNLDQVIAAMKDAKHISHAGQ
jgi:arylsulfatase